MTWQMYWRNWWKAWPTYSVSGEQPFLPHCEDIIIDHVLCFGAIQIRWRSIR